jgi:hypothetical protein
MWSCAVVVTDVDAEDVVELAAADDQHSVEALVANSAHSALHESVRVRCLERCANDINVLAREEGVEGARELGSWSWIRNRSCRSRSSSSMSRLRACCSIQAVFGLLVQATYSIRRLPIERKART